VTQQAPGLSWQNFENAPAPAFWSGVAPPGFWVLVCVPPVPPVPGGVVVPPVGAAVPPVLGVVVPLVPLEAPPVVPVDVVVVGVVVVADVPVPLPEPASVFASTGGTRAGVVVGTLS